MFQEIPAQGLASLSKAITMIACCCVAPFMSGCPTKDMVSDLCRQTNCTCLLRAGAATSVDFKISSSHPVILSGSQVLRVTKL